LSYSCESAGESGATARPLASRAGVRAREGVMACMYGGKDCSWPYTGHDRGCPEYPNEQADHAARLKRRDEAKRVTEWRTTYHMILREFWSAHARAVAAGFAPDASMLAQAAHVGATAAADAAHGPLGEGKP
jgi:hypothetical protein